MTDGENFLKLFYDFICIYQKYVLPLQPNSEKHSGADRATYRNRM